MQTVEIRHFHLFCGLGGGARGFNRGVARVGKLQAKFRCLGGIDVDPAAIKDFERLSGVPGTALDLFSTNQYIAFHRQMPPTDWREATADDIRRSAGGERPHIVFLSAPCKGFSGLLSENLSKSGRYQALNGLTLRGIRLMLEAWRDDPPELIIFENVPRIQTRGRKLLDQINQLLRAAGYAVAETKHNCGVIGGLAQSRERFLLVARHQAKVPPLMYEPPKRKLRGVGEVIGLLPLPGDERSGPMHRVPMLHWKTWVRLAFVEAGSDWRSLNKLAVEDGVLKDYAIIPEGQWKDGTLGVVGWGDNMGAVTGRAEATTGKFSVADPREFTDRHNGTHGVVPWEENAGTVTGDARPSKGAFAVADPRDMNGAHHGSLGVLEWDKAAGAVAGSTRPTNGRFAVADPRSESFKGGLGVCGWDETAGTVAGESFPTNGKFAVADPRREEGRAEFGQYGVKRWDETSQAVIGKAAAGAGNFSVADPRMGKSGPRFNNVYRVVAFADTSPAVTGGTGPTAGGLAVADPRAAAGSHTSKYRVTSFGEPSGTVIAASTTGQGAFAVADPRYDGENKDYGQFGVNGWDDSTGTLTSQRSPGQGRFSVADPRCNWNPGAHTNKLRVVPFDQPTGAITGSSSAGHGFTSGAMCVADPRPDYLREGRDKYQTAGMYGVLPWGEPSGAVAAAGQHDNGRWSVADPREAEGEETPGLPEPNDRLVAVIRALDGTWHRPFTTLELAALQSLVDPDEYLALDGASDSDWRERIGNAVPPDAAEAIAGVMGRVLLQAWSGESFQLSNESIWVREVAIGLSVDFSQQVAF